MPCSPCCACLCLARVEFQGFLLKVVMTMAPTFLTRPKLVAVAFAVSEGAAKHA